ncbi:Crp/Fnr family transcriptional regulator [Sphingopyxis sp. JAI128]|uniref:Crp/Fnr family transcriptional regulator n=1 Tax=Sphingopyxis sp. JAI128 TaxID=2723066 RepID=UPI00161E1A15|nr:Crp/Fnr family transcriptional regulator [Sphingopyxis sp. JAI128]MBB6425902.1 CRP-like cAMP-binding protein [Sphingopyxis sp. JAI128]
MQRSYQLALAERTRLAGEERDRLLAAREPRGFADGQFVQHQGDPGDAFWAVIEGNVLVGRYAEDGAFTAFAVLGPGDIFGELAFFTGLERQVDAIASGPARLVAIDRSLLRRLMQEDVGWAELLLRSLGRQLAVSLDIIDAERRLPTAERLRHLLAAMAADAPDGCTVAATQQQLADLLGVSRVTLGAALRSLEARGELACGYRHIRLRAPLSPGG